RAYQPSTNVAMNQMGRRLKGMVRVCFQYSRCLSARCTRPSRWAVLLGRRARVALRRSFAMFFASLAQGCHRILSAGCCIAIRAWRWHETVRWSDEALRILITEDDAALGEALRHSLSHNGYAVDWIRNGALADEALRTDVFDLLILDLGLPQLDGYAILKRLRKHDGRIPVLILSGRESAGDKVQG